ncbi:MAG: DDE-type integrase/transposase/recombinase [Planctomycetota bacterium]
MALDPLRVAVWRFEQIGSFLDPTLTSGERHRLIRAAARVPVGWPSGREGPVPLSTLYRWCKRYRKDPRIESLMDHPPPARAVRAIPPEWLQYALALVEQEPARSLYVLAGMLQDQFRLAAPPSQASLHRALQKEPRYRNLRNRARGEARNKIRRRFQATQPHEIWHADAKGKFSVTFTNGSTKTLRIMTILDDATRFVLRALIVAEETLAAAVATFRQAAGRFGLPEKFYADRHAVYDSLAFRNGLGVLGIHRINTRPRNAGAHGKIEAYHRVLKRWFIKELPHQPVLDLPHLQGLLDAVIDQRYHQHPHRELKQTSRQALADRMSRRTVTLERLREVFLVERTLVYHRKDRTIRVAGILFRIPREVEAPGRKVTIAIDPEEPAKPYLRLRQGNALQPLLPAVHPAGDRQQPVAEPPEPGGPGLPAPGGREEPAGSLTPLLEKYRGRTLAQARPGFGLPEIYQAFAQALGRPVPYTETEAHTVLSWLAKRGPFPPEAFHAALSKTIKSLGASRPLAQILQALDRKIRPLHGKEDSL